VADFLKRGTDYFRQEVYLFSFSLKYRRYIDVLHFWVRYLERPRFVFEPADVFSLPMQHGALRVADKLEGESCARY
jgi:hypothetical protein